MKGKRKRERKGNKSAFVMNNRGNNEMRTTKMVYIKDSLFVLLPLAPVPMDMAVSRAQLWRQFHSLAFPSHAFSLLSLVLFSLPVHTLAFLPSLFPIANTYAGRVPPLK